VVELLVLALAQRLGFVLDAGAVDGHVDAAVVRHRLVDQCFDFVGDRYICFNEQGLAACFDDQGGGHVAAVHRRVGDDDAGARAPECERHRAPEAACRARYQHNLAGIRDAARCLFGHALHDASFIIAWRNVSCL
jgi:hypothetical protein